MGSNDLTTKLVIVSDSKKAQADFKRLRGSTDKTFKKMEADARRASASMKRNIGAGTRNMAASVKTSWIGIGAAAYAGYRVLNKIGNTIDLYSQFEKQMATNAGVANATTAEFTRLSKSARQLAIDLPGVAATDVAEGQYYLASAGHSVNQIMKEQADVLRLAVGTNYDLAKSADLVTATMSQYDLGAEDATRITNIYSAATQQSQATMRKLADSMRYVGGPAKSVGMTLEQTVGVLMKLYDAGLKGEQAGTSLRMGLIQLAKPTKEVKSALTELNIEFKNIDGSARPAIQILSDLTGQTLTLNQSARLFGAEAAPGMQVALKKIKGSFADAGKSVTGTTAALDLYLKMIATTWGKTQTFRATVQELALTVGESLAPALVRVIDLMQPMIGNLSSLTEEMKSYVKQIGGTVDLLLSYIETAERANKLISDFKTFTSDATGGLVNFQGPLKVVVDDLGGLGEAFAKRDFSGVIGILLSGITTLDIETNKLTDTQKRELDLIVKIQQARTLAAANATTLLKKHLTEIAEAYKTEKEITGNKTTAPEQKGAGKYIEQLRYSTASAVDRLKIEYDRDLKNVGDSVEGKMLALKKYTDAQKKLEETAASRKLSKEKETTARIKLLKIGLMNVDAMQMMRWKKLTLNKTDFAIFQAKMERDAYIAVGADAIKEEEIYQGKRKEIYKQREEDVRKDLSGMEGLNKDYFKNIDKEAKEANKKQMGYLSNFSAFFDLTMAGALNVNVKTWRRMKESFLDAISTMKNGAGSLLKSMGSIFAGLGGGIAASVLGGVVNKLVTPVINSISDGISNFVTKDIFGIGRPDNSKQTKYGVKDAQKNPMGSIGINVKKFSQFAAAGDAFGAAFNLQQMDDINDRFLTLSELTPELAAGFDQLTNQAYETGVTIETTGLKSDKSKTAMQNLSSSASDLTLDLILSGKASSKAASFAADLATATNQAAIEADKQFTSITKLSDAFYRASENSWALARAGEGAAAAEAEMNLIADIGYEKYQALKNAKEELTRVEKRREDLLKEALNADKARYEAIQTELKKLNDEAERYNNIVEGTPKATKDNTDAVNDNSDATDGQTTSTGKLGGQTQKTTRDIGLMTASLNKMKTSTGLVTSKIDLLKNSLDKLPANKRIIIDISTRESGKAAAGGEYYVPGDNLPYLLHRGEAVLSSNKGDAQLYRELKAGGDWDRMKSYRPEAPPVSFSIPTGSVGAGGDGVTIGSITIPIYQQPGQSGKELAEEVIDHIRDISKRGARVVHQRGVFAGR